MKRANRVVEGTTSANAFNAMALEVRVSCVLAENVDDNVVAGRAASKRVLLGSSKGWSTHEPYLLMLWMMGEDNLPSVRSSAKLLFAVYWNQREQRGPSIHFGIQPFFSKFVDLQHLKKEPGCERPP